MDLVDVYSDLVCRRGGGDLDDLRLGCSRVWMHGMMTYVDPVTLSATSFSKTSAPPGSIEHICELYKALVYPVPFWIHTDSTLLFALIAPLCYDYTTRTFVPTRSSPAQHVERCQR